MQYRKTPNIYNGNKQVKDTSGETVEFLRDPDRLFAQYEPLRKRVYKDFKGYFDSYADQEELKSYIDEMFVRLVKEYDINGAIDFAGYVKNMLVKRVKFSYLEKCRKQTRLEFIITDEEASERIFTEQSSDDDRIDLEYYALFEDIFSSAVLTEVEQEVVLLLLQEKMKKEIIEELTNRGFVGTEVSKSIDEVAELIKEKLRNP